MRVSYHVLYALINTILAIELLLSLINAHTHYVSHVYYNYLSLKLVLYVDKYLTVIELISCVSATVSFSQPPPPPTSITAFSSATYSSSSSSSFSEENLKVFKVVRGDIAIWSKPSSNKDPTNKNLVFVHKGRVLSGWVVTNEHGKFLQLESNDGYVAIKRTGDDSDSCKELPFEKISSVYSINEASSSPEGYALRIFPDYKNNLCKAKGTLLFPPGSSFPVSSGRTIGEFGDIFVRVKHPAGPLGWLFETRTGEDCLKCIRTGNDKIEMEREAAKLLNLLRRKKEEEEEAKRREEARKREEEARKLEEEARKREEEARKQREEEERRVAEAAQKRIAKGVKCTWSLSSFDSLPENSNIEDVSCVVISNGGYCAVQYSSNVYFDGISTDFYNLLKRQQFTNVDYIATGRYGQYFLQKQNGKKFWAGLPSSLEELINVNGNVKTLVLGGSYCYFVNFSNGRTCWAGLNDKVSTLIRGNTVVTLWIGDSDSYYLKYTVNGSDRCSYKNLPYKLQKYATNTSMDIRQVLYDRDTDTCFVRYNPA